MPSTQLTEKKILNKNLNDLDNNINSCNDNLNVNQNNFKCDSSEKPDKSRVESDLGLMEVPFKELLIATDDFSNDRILGSGGND
jgi:hypothetical protein